ncbi:hypothetical protein M446_0307 [Methylobacterium sp. 4-46]|uniref:hypothetical protein n=1 Tax=unclassified Methylobacterium TaxID=2615210 RepID=UPI000165C575|nr:MULTISPECIES: hypothetical protein [Methylobacterium]ACA14878.1 hypothetical protein M446_0307 [Methylobacterium sp. 4-46]WFT80618.1 hypothetical protein QA634_01545 [Methylobacterium nodulans]
MTFSHRLARAACRLGLAAAPSLTAGPALAQTASQITPPSFRPPLQRQGGVLVIPDGAGWRRPQARSGSPSLRARPGSRPPSPGPRRPSPPASPAAP